MSQRPEPPHIVSVSTQSQMDEFLEVCRTQGQFAFDTEFVMEDSFQPELCLVQLATSDRVAIIDPFDRIDLAPVWALVCDPAVETIVHAGQEDLAICVHRMGEAPRSIFDAQIAGGFAGLGYPLSLQKLVQSTLRIRLHKSKTLTDWRRRPLTEAQIRYGAEDVCYLPAIRNKLETRLTAARRTGWMRTECLRFEDMSLYRRADDDKLMRVKGSGSLGGRPLAVLRDLLAWRESTAGKLNRPLRAVLKDHLMIEIAKHELADFAEVRHLRGLNLSDRHVRDLCGVVIGALGSDPQSWPEPHPRETESPSESVLLPMITGVLRSYCFDNDLAYGLLASKKSIQDFVRHSRGSEPRDRSAVELLEGWRGEAVGQLLEELMSGEVAVRIGRNRNGAVLDLGRRTPDARQSHPRVD